MSVYTTNSTSLGFSEWEKLQQHVNNKEVGYFLKHLVKKITKQHHVETTRFAALFDEFKKALFGGGTFLPSQVRFSAADYVKIDQVIRDFDLSIFWRHVQKEHGDLNLPSLNRPEEIRFYLMNHPVKLSQIKSLKMNGIFEIWHEFSQKYQLPNFKTEEELHVFLEDKNNQTTIFKIITYESTRILENTTRLPEEIRYFKNLKALTFSNRRAFVLPKGLSELTQLEELNVCHTELCKISKKIGSLPQLSKVCLTGTLFTQFPKQLHQLNLQELIIKNKIKMIRDKSQ